LPNWRSSVPGASSSAVVSSTPARLSRRANMFRSSWTELTVGDRCAMSGEMVWAGSGIGVTNLIRAASRSPRLGILDRWPKQAVLWNNLFYQRVAQTIVCEQAELIF